MDSRYEVESETKLKLKFLEELDKLEKKRHEEQEREKLLRAIKVKLKKKFFIAFLKLQLIKLLLVRTIKNYFLLNIYYQFKTNSFTIVKFD